MSIKPTNSQGRSSFGQAAQVYYDERTRKSRTNKMKGKEFNRRG